MRVLWIENVIEWTTLANRLHQQSLINFVVLHYITIVSILNKKITENKKIYCFLHVILCNIITLN